MPTAIAPTQPRRPERVGVHVRSVRLTPQGHLHVEAGAAGSAVLDHIGAQFALGTGHGLLALALDAATAALPLDLAYWRDFAGQFVNLRRRGARCVGRQFAEKAEGSAVKRPRHCRRFRDDGHACFESFAGAPFQPHPASNHDEPIVLMQIRRHCGSAWGVRS